jgi:hypothetical protein
MEYEIRRDGVLLGTTTVPEFTETFNFVHGDKYTWGIKTICSENASITAAASATANCEFCNPVSDLTVEFYLIEETPCAATLEWTANVNMIDATYNIYRNGIQIATDISETKYIDLDSDGGITHTWTVKTVCKGEETEGVDVEGECEVCDPVTSVEITIQNCAIATITWTAVAGAKGYEIRRDNILLGTVTTPAFTESAEFEHGKSYIWKIKTICNETESTEVSASATADCTGINELANRIAIFPNPSNTSVTINAKEFSKVEIYNPIGQLIETVNVNSVDVSHYDSGIYFFKIYDIHNNSVTKRVMVAR